MLEGIFEAFRIPEVRKRLLYTLGAIAVFRLGAWIPVPGIDAEQLKQFIASLQQTAGALFGFVNMFTGGALERFSIFALGVIPYINASIILSLLIPIVPHLKELQQQGEEGRRVINRYTRYGTVLLAFLQALGTSAVMVQAQVAQPTFGFYAISVLSLVTGTMFLMWLGERITENGIGRGISMIIMVGIIADYPRFFSSLYLQMTADPGQAIWVPVLLFVFVMVVAGVVLVQLGARRIEIQYAKRIVRGKVLGGHHHYLPLQVNQGGVIPIIFAAAILTLPQALLQFAQQRFVMPDWLQWLSSDLQGGGALYLLMYALLIVFFTYFYSTIVFNPRDLADNLRKWGGFIPGIRPGRPTTEYIESIQARLLLIGALFLVAIALLPYLFAQVSGLGFNVFFIGGTSILIVVGVAVDTIKQIEAHMVERHYESLIRKGALLGRRI